MPNSLRTQFNKVQFESIEESYLTHLYFKNLYVLCGEIFTILTKLAGGEHEWMDR